MTPKQQRIAIAKTCGWKAEQLASGWLWTHPDYSPRLNIGCPDYLNDLNDMHEAEKMLTKEQYSRYAWIVLQGTPARELECREFFSATAAQRAEAFLRTLNLWVD